ncbi:MAG: hypothetical protein HQK52_12835 [Oligoflexia bacterium]|nr:hypothetical protein [Oligoflexia bacterium]
MKAKKTVFSIFFSTLAIFAILVWVITAKENGNYTATQWHVLIAFWGAFFGASLFASVLNLKKYLSEKNRKGLSISFSS